jgi:hypothetical protein
MEINELGYGNPNQFSLIYLDQETYLDSLLTELKSYPFPENSGEMASQEIKELIGYAEHLKKDEPQAKEMFKRFMAYDADFETFMINKLRAVGIDDKELRDTIAEVKKDISPLVMKLKYFYNRPRPYQLAYQKKLPLHAWKSISADTPSYPSGHTFQSRVYAEVLGNMYPKYYKALHDVATDIMWSRLYLGVHYMSDNEFSTYMYDVVIKHPEFTKKYKL